MGLLVHAITSWDQWQHGCSLSKAYECFQHNFKERYLSLILVKKFDWPIYYTLFFFFFFSAPEFTPTLGKSNQMSVSILKMNYVNSSPCTCLPSPTTLLWHLGKSSQCETTKYVETILRLVDRNTGVDEWLCQRKYFPLNIQNTSIFLKELYRHSILGKPN